MTSALDKPAAGIPTGPATSYDLVLVFDYFRSATPFLALIGALASRYRIGLCLLPISDDLRAKAGVQQDRFVEACLAAGAERIEGGGHRCGLLIVQQRPFTDSAVAEVLDRVQPARIVGLMALAMAGLDVHERYLSQFGVDKVYVPCDRFRRFLVQRREAQAAYEGIEIDQVGLPYARQRLEPRVEADWIIATPTSFSFRREAHRQAFLTTVLRLLDQIDPGDTVLYKPHNGEWRDYMAPPRAARLAQMLRVLPGAEVLARAAAALPGAAGERLGRLYTAMLHERVLRRCTPMRAVTDRDWLPFEAFLPGIRKGVIGGLSNTIWGTLYFGLPFYNCVDRTLRDQVSIEEATTRKDPSNLLDLNLEFFGVPYCSGRLDFDGARGEGIVRDEDRRGDLIASVEADLVAAREQRTCAG